MEAQCPRLLVAVHVDEAEEFGDCVVHLLVVDVDAEGQELVEVDQAVLVLVVLRESGVQSRLYKPSVCYRAIRIKHII